MLESEQEVRGVCLGAHVSETHFVPIFMINLNKTDGSNLSTASVSYMVTFIVSAVDGILRRKLSCAEEANWGSLPHRFI